jgi:ubiquinone/menaquinone biosynthesis C-methylase UbiE
MSKRQAFFDEAAASWDRQFDTPKLRLFLEARVPAFNLKPGQKVLDLGTGTGVLIPFLLRAVGSAGSVVAVDYSARMVEKCRQKHGQNPNVNFIVTDAEQLQFFNETFDAIACFSMFPHLEHKEKALGEMNRVLKRQGKLVIAHALGSRELAVHHKSASPVVADDVLPTEETMCRLLRKAGFSGIKITDSSGCYLCLSTKI